MARQVTIYVLFHQGVFRDVFASYSEAVRHLSDPGHEMHCCTIKQFRREDY